MRSIRSLPVIVLIALITIGVAGKAKHSPAFLSMDRKVALLEANAEQPPAQPQTTELTEQELNAYLSEGGVELPKGIDGAKFEFKPAVVHATASVNFDELAEGRTGNNPIFSALFSGTHDVEAQAQASGTHGQGTVAVDWVKLDGVEVPRAALEYLIKHYVKPKYPSAGMTTQFLLPLRIDMAVVSAGKVSLTQR